MKKAPLKLVKPIQLSLFTVLIATALFATALFAAETEGYSERYELLRKQVFAVAYDDLPRYEVTRQSFQSNSESGAASLGEDANRTLTSNDDLLGPERGPKLLQANGICFSGYWEVDQDNSFSGVFRPGGQIPIIARASTIFSGTQQSERRALGLAVKLMPGDLGDAPSLNVFTSHSVGGVKQPYLLNLSMDNEPPLGRIPSLRDIPTALKLKSTLLEADREAGSTNPSITYRGVTALGEYNAQGIGKSPHWIRFSPKTVERIDRDDFRDELRVENYPAGKLIYNIDVGDQSNVVDKTKKKKSRADWQTIGQLVFAKSITSKVCDTQLHFPHPKN